MLKKTHEIVTTFRDENHTLVGILVQNGTSEFYRTTHAQKEHVAQLLEVDTPTNTH